jgi:hypothetical protein
VSGKEGEEHMLSYDSDRDRKEKKLKEINQMAKKLSAGGAGT